VPSQELSSSPFRSHFQAGALDVHFVFYVHAELISPSSHVQTVIPRKRSLSLLHTYAPAAFTQVSFMDRVAFIAL
jgi:hypothetical protein